MSDAGLIDWSLTPESPEFLKAVFFHILKYPSKEAAIKVFNYAKIRYHYNKDPEHEKMIREMKNALESGEIPEDIEQLEKRWAEFKKEKLMKLNDIFPEGIQIP